MKFAHTHTSTHKSHQLNQSIDVNTSHRIDTKADIQNYYRFVCWLRLRDRVRETSKFVYFVYEQSVSLLDKYEWCLIQCFVYFSDLKKNNRKRRQRKKRKLFDRSMWFNFLLLWHISIPNIWTHFEYRKIYSIYSMNNELDAHTHTHIYIPYTHGTFAAYDFQW